jgi:hypothetical protein
MAVHHSSNSHVRSQSNSSQTIKLYRSTVPGLRRILFTEEEVISMFQLWRALHPDQSAPYTKSEALPLLGVERV